MNTEIERLEAEEIEVEEQVPISAAGFRIAMSIGIKGGKLKHTLQVMSDKAAAEQKQKNKMQSMRKLLLL